MLKKKHAESLQRVLVPFRVTVGKQDSQTARRDKGFMVRSGASQTLQYALLCTSKCVGTNGDKQEVVNWKVSFYHASINSILNVNMNIFMGSLYNSQHRLSESLTCPKQDRFYNWNTPNELILAQIKIWRYPSLLDWRITWYELNC